MMQFERLVFVRQGFIPTQNTHILFKYRVITSVLRWSFIYTYTVYKALRKSSDTHN